MVTAPLAGSPAHPSPPTWTGRSPFRAALRLVAGLVLLAGATALPPPVAAGCSDGEEGAWPSFRLAAGTASRIVIGEVVAGSDPDDLGRSGSFRLRVDEQLRGVAPTALALTQPEVRDAPCHPELRVAIGEVLAVALPASDPALDPGETEAVAQVIAVAFVRMDPGRADPPPGIEVLTVAEARTLAASPGLPMPVIIVVAVMAILGAARRWVAESAAERSGRPLRS